jgi:uncharacterized membrane protein YeaQ/YmgE (transglycosylase-associated protein family)
MKSNMGLVMNIVLGIVGAAIASAMLSYFGIVCGFQRADSVPMIADSGG